MPCVGPCQPALTFTQLEKVWTDAGGTAAMAPLMAAIALAESGGVPNNANPTDNGGRQTSWGLWQVSQGNHTPYANWADPTANAKVAQSKLATQGLTAWGTYTSGAAGRILSANLGGQTAAQVLTATATQGGAAQAGPAGVDNEGNLFDISFGIGHLTMRRATARKAVGGAVVVTGGLVALAGVFVLTGSAKRLPGPLRAVSGAVGGVRQAGVERRAARAESAAVVPADELGARRRAKAREQRGRAAEADYSSARDEGRRTADQAGPF